MSNFNSLLSRVLLRNGALLTIPPLVISLALWSLLPSAYAMESFWKDIPIWLGVSENVLRITVFALPAFLYFGQTEEWQRWGWPLYWVGILAYLASYLAQVLFPDSSWSRSAVGFTAPAWTTLFWFCGIGLVCKDTWLPVPWTRVVYVGCAVLFVSFHVAHTGLIFGRQP